MDHSSHADGSNDAGVIHTQFNSKVPGTDFIVQSSDGVVFYLHRKNLALYTDGAFPGVHDSANAGEPKQIVRLEEPSCILEIVFQFMYPRRQPSIKDLGFQTILAVADAVEKYKVFAAMTVCEEALKDYLQEQSLPIFLHALRYRLPNLLNRCAIYLSRKPLLSVVDYIPSTSILPWLRYVESWKGVFDAHLKKLDARGRSDPECYSLNVFETAALCSSCVLSITSWISLLQRMDKTPDLKAALTASIEPTRLSSTYIFDIAAFSYPRRPFSQLLAVFQSCCTMCSRLGHGRCLVMKGMAERMLKDIEELPPFTTFLNEDLDGEAVVADK